MNVYVCDVRRYTKFGKFVTGSPAHLYPDPLPHFHRVFLSQASWNWPVDAGGMTAQEKTCLQGLRASGQVP